MTCRLPTNLPVGLLANERLTQPKVRGFNARTFSGNSFHEPSINKRVPLLSALTGCMCVWTERCQWVPAASARREQIVFIKSGGYWVNCGKQQKGSFFSARGVLMGQFVNLMNQRIHPLNLAVICTAFWLCAPAGRAQPLTARAIPPLKVGTPAPVGRWDRFEAALTNSTRYANPYADVTLEVRFTRPDRSTFDFWGFHDGENIWRFRCLADQPGRWRYRARFSDGA